MSLQTDIRNIVNTLSPTATYVLSSWFKANRKSFDIEEMTQESPFIILNNERPEETEIKQNMNYVSNTQLIMWFLIKGDVYQNDQDMDDALEQLKPLVYQVANNIYQLDSVRLNNNEIAKFKITPRFKIFNSVLIGWEFTANWKFNSVPNWCKGSSDTVTADSDTVTADSDTVTADGGTV